MQKLSIFVVLILVSCLGTVRSQEVKMLFAGDIMAHDVNITQKDHNDIYSYVRSNLAEHHLNFVNVETIVSNTITPQGYPRFSVKPEYVKAAINAGFNVFCLANNHVADHQVSGIIDTKNAWMNFTKAYPKITTSGLKEVDDPFIFETIQVEGLKVGFIAVTQFLNWQETGYIGQDHVYIVNFLHDQEKKFFIEAVRAFRSTVDVLVVGYHGGVEYMRSIENTKLAFFKELIEAGTDIVWASHPQVLQPWLYHQNGIIINSNGNFISGQTWGLTSKDFKKDRAFTGDTLLYSVQVNKDKKGKVTVKMVDTIPLSNYRHPEKGMIVINLEKLSTYSFLPSDWLVFYQERLHRINYMRKPLEEEEMSIR